MSATNIPNPGQSARPEAISPGWCGCWWYSATIDQAIQQIKAAEQQRVQRPAALAGAGWCWGTSD
jgi:hypothetical protein